MLDLTVYNPLIPVFILMLGLTIINLLLIWLLPTYSQKDISFSQQAGHQDDE